MDLVLFPDPLKLPSNVPIISIPLSGPYILLKLNVISLGFINFLLFNTPPPPFPSLKSISRITKIYLSSTVNDLAGPPGVGKTTTILCLARHLLGPSFRKQPFSINKLINYLCVFEFMGHLFPSLLISRGDSTTSPYFLSSLL